MPYTPKILAFSGSSRPESFNRKLLKNLVRGAKNAGGDVTVLNFDDLWLPLFEQGLQQREGIHPNAKKFKAMLKENQGLLVASPEHNHFVPALMKNAIDWASRSEEGEKPLEALKGKYVSVSTASPGVHGGARALPFIRIMFMNVQMHVIPEHVTISGAGKAFDENDLLIDEKLRERAEGAGAALVEILRKVNA